MGFCAVTVCTVAVLHGDGFARWHDGLSTARKRRHSRNLLSGNPESLLFVVSAPTQLKTLDSVSEENIVATLPCFPTARNDGPRHFPTARNDGPGHRRGRSRFPSPARRFKHGAQAPSFPRSVKRESRVFCRRHQSMSSYKSRQYGLASSIKFNFHFLLHFFIRFSRAIAATMSACISK